MTITHKGQGRFIIKTKAASIELGQTVKIGEKELPGIGEYEVAGVEVEGHEDGVFLLRAEDIYVLYLGRLNRPLNNNELDSVNLADILIVPVGGKSTDVDDLSVLDPEAAVKMINQVDPRIVIPMYFASIEPFRAAEGKPLEMMSELKITRSGLPVEDRQVVVLT